MEQISEIFGLENVKRPWHWGFEKVIHIEPEEGSGSSEEESFVFAA